MSFSAIIHAMTHAGKDTMPFPRALEGLADCGFDSVMLMSRPGGPALTPGHTPDACLLDLVQSDLDLVRGCAEQAGLCINSVYASGVNASDPSAEAGSIASLRAVAEVARRLDCRFLGHSGGRAEAPGMEVADKQEGIARLARIVDAVAAEAPEMRFGVDVHYHGLVESIADCEGYLERLACDNAGILLNTGHMTTCGEPGWELAASHPDRTPIIGWKDHLTGPDLEKPVVSVQLGTGDTPLRRYVEAMKPQTVERVSVINVEDVPPEESAAALQASREYLEDLWDSVEVQSV